MTTEIIIKNANRSRKFGYGISTTPSGHGTEIEPPTTPDYTGTLKQIEDQVEADHLYLNSIQNVHKSRRWFYDGQPIEAVWGVGIVSSVPCDCIEDDPDCPKCKGWGSVEEWGWGWLRARSCGDNFPFDSKGEMKIRVSL